MVVHVRKEDAVRALPYIEDARVFKAVNLAIWLILDKGRTLKYAIDTAANKHNVKPKIAIERLVRIAIPEEFFWSRVSSARPKGVGQVSLAGGKAAAVRNEKMLKIEREGKKHIVDITQRQSGQQGA